jgi:TctA family transporter
MMSQGDPGILVQRPISATMLAVAVLLLVTPAISWFNRARVKAITENG